MFKLLVLAIISFSSFSFDIHNTVSSCLYVDKKVTRIKQSKNELPGNKFYNLFYRRLENDVCRAIGITEAINKKRNVTCYRSELKHQCLDRLMKEIFDKSKLSSAGIVLMMGAQAKYIFDMKKKGDEFTRLTKKALTFVTLKSLVKTTLDTIIYMLNRYKVTDEFKDLKMMDYKDIHPRAYGRVASNDKSVYKEIDKYPYIKSKEFALSCAHIADQIYSYKYIYASLEKIESLLKIAHKKVVEIQKKGVDKGNVKFYKNLEDHFKQNLEELVVYRKEANDKIRNKIKKFIE